MEASTHLVPAHRFRLALGGLDMVAIGLLAVLGLGGLVHHYDAGWLLSGDALYPIQMLETPALEYRPPTPNRLFPDIMVHALVQLFATDFLTQKIVAGSILLLLVSVAVSITKGKEATLATLAITCACGFGCFDSTSHYSLPISIVLFQAVRRADLRLAVLFVIVFSDPMVLLPLSILALREERMPTQAEWLVTGAAFLLTTLYSEFSLSAVHVILLFPAWTAGFWFARRLGLLGPACIAVCGVLVLASWVGIIPARYSLPVTASIALLFFETRLQAPDIRAFLWPAAIVALFLATLDTTRAQRLTADFDCLGATLASRGIEAVAADHWTAKPLALSDAAAGRTTRITQISFDDGRYHPWMSPHSSYGPATVWAVGNRDTCAVITPEARYCGQANTAPVVSKEPVCGIFDLYRYAVPLPLVPEPRPAGKWAAIDRNFMLYVDKALAPLQRRLPGRTAE